MNNSAAISHINLGLLRYAAILSFFFGPLATSLRLPLHYFHGVRTTERLFTVLFRQAGERGLVELYRLVFQTLIFIELDHLFFQKKRNQKQSGENRTQ